MALVSTRSGRRYSNRNPALEPEDYGNTTPFDDRVRLPLKDRQVRREVLADGTVVINYEDPPIGAEQRYDLPPLPEPPKAPETPENSPGQQSRELDRRKGLR